MLEALAEIVHNTNQRVAPSKTERFGTHFQWNIPIDKDHTATLTMDDDTYNAFVLAYALKVGDE